VPLSFSLPNSAAYIKNLPPVLASAVYGQLVLASAVYGQLVLALAVYRQLETITKNQYYPLNT
jgi:hypothetical protein